MNFINLIQPIKSFPKKNDERIIKNREKVPTYNVLSYICLVCCTVLLAFSCSVKKDQVTLRDTGINNDIAEIEQWKTSSPDVLFDQSTLHTFELNLALDSLNLLDNAPADEVYVEGSMTFDGDTMILEKQTLICGQKDI